MGQKTLVPDTVAPLVLSAAEAADLERFTRCSYISPTDYPALARLLARIDRQVRETTGCR